MADLNAVLQALVLADQQAKANSPYAPVSQFTEQMNPTILQAAGSGQYKPGESMAAGLINGLIGGFSQNLTNSYADKQNNLAYQAMSNAMTGKGGKPEGIHPSVFAPIRAAGSVFSLGRGLEQVDDQADLDRRTRAQIRADVASQIARNPEAADSILAGLARLDGREPVAASRPIVEEAPVEDPLGLGEPYKVRFDRAMKEARSKGLTGNASLEYAQTLLKPDALANTQAEKTINGLREKVNAFDSIIASAEAGVAGAGNTGGFGGGVRDYLSTVAAAMGSDDQVNKQTAQSMLDTVGPEVIKAFRTAGVGSMSDREELRYVGAGPSSDKTPEANRAIIEKMRAVADLDREYLNFLEQTQARYGSTKGADKIWQQYKAAQPPFLQVGSEFVPNTNRIPFQQWLENPTAPVDMPAGNIVRESAIPSAGSPPPGLSFEEFQAWKRGSR